ncbi:MAG: sulfite exporter TauE/SafE family protein [Pleurocapsa minor GSE-CHR-MK-17-07R]|jgi:cytochrome c-type biogenesis protein|nr:sulfite exporter TauE/SafE family protein [Pleurocapsa minor GSE-CHR-MK 17-07R]
MTEFLQAFSLGSAAILTNACMLPLYPGLLAFMAGTATTQDGSKRRFTALLGVLVLAGVLTIMVAIGLVLYLLNQAFSSLLTGLLPVIYGVVIVFGILLLLDKSPFARLAASQSPILKNPYITAYLYGMLLGPMTLPCTGPIITSAFLLSATGSQSLVQSMLYFLFFGLGFGWPLVLLPLLASPFQKRLVRWLAGHHALLNRVSGVLLIAVGIFGLLTEIVPQVVISFEPTPALWTVYWLIVAGLIALLLWRGLRPNTSADASA